MNKKIKSLIVTGLLMVGMCGTAFADNVYVNDALIVKNIKLEEVFTFQDGNVLLELDEASNTLLADLKISWVEKYNFTYVKLTLKDGTEVNIPLEKIGVSRNDETGLIRDTIDLDDLGLDAKNVKTVKIGIEYKYPQDEDGNGVPDFKDDEPVEPEDPEIHDPETGDSSLVTVVGASVVTLSAAGLFIVNKKKEDE